MKEEEMLKILLDWNFWKRELETGIKRSKYVNKVLNLLRTNFIITIIGPRRAGKSFILRQVVKSLIERGVEAERTLVINFEDRRIEKPSWRTLDDLFEVYERNLSPKEIPFVFLDEIHRVKEWDRWVRTIHELGKAKIVITGSSSSLLKREMSSTLTGRHLDIFVFPLDFQEFLRFKKVFIKNKLDVLENLEKIKRLLKEYLEFGGFPEVVLSEFKEEILLSYFEDIIRRDIIERYHIRKIESLFSLAKFYLSNISKRITFNSISEFLDISVDTVSEYSRYLEEVFMIFFLRMFHPSLKKQEKAPRKIYSIDTGLANTVGFKIKESISKPMENLVAIELLREKSINKRLEIYYWKEYGKEEGKEVDFVIKEGAEVKELVQVTYAEDDNDISKREFEGLLKASDQLRCKNLKIITWDAEGEVIKDKKRIEMVPLWKFLLKDIIENNR